MTEMTDLWYVPGDGDEPGMLVREVFDTGIYARVEIQGWTPLARVEMDAGRPYRAEANLLPASAVRLVPEQHRPPTLVERLRAAITQRRAASPGIR
jgi:hypothetical protein